MFPISKVLSLRKTSALSIQIMTSFVNLILGPRNTYIAYRVSSIPTAPQCSALSDDISAASPGVIDASPQTVPVDFSLE